MQHLVLSFATNDGCFAAAVQCHVCHFEPPTERGFEDKQTAREAATHAWLDGTEPLPLIPSYRAVVTRSATYSSSL